MEEEATVVETTGSVFIEPPMEICLFCGEGCGDGISFNRRIMKIKLPESELKWSHLECYMHFVMDEYLKDKLGK